MPRNVKLLVPHLAIPCAGFAVLALVIFLYNKAPVAYYLFMYSMTKLTAPTPFADWAWMPSAIRCWGQGIDVYVNNTCYDVWPNLAFNYPPIWLRLRFLLPLEPYTKQIGLLLVSVFILSLAALPPPSGRRGYITALLATLSCATVLAAERGNADLIIFLLVVSCLRLRQLALAFRLAGYGLLILAGLLKFYPFVALLLVLRERVTVVLVVGFAAAATLVASTVAYRDELTRLVRNLPGVSYFTMQFGAAGLPNGLGITLSGILHDRLHQSPETAEWLGGILASSLWPLLIAATFIAAVALSRRLDLPRMLARLPAIHADSLVLGAVLICGCFFAGQSVIYRGIFLLLTLPGLTKLGAERGRLVWATACAASVFVLWTPFLELIADALVGVADRIPYQSKTAPDCLAAYLLWLATETAWWWIVTTLLAILGSFVVSTQMWCVLSERLPSWLPVAKQRHLAAAERVAP